MPNSTEATESLSEPQDDLQWQIERYVLADATLDRASFEHRMLEDPQLALAVAKAVEDLAEISAAANLPDREPVVHNNENHHKGRSRRIMQIMAATAATILIVFLASRPETSSSSSSSNAPVAAEDDTLSQVAENWLVLHPAEFAEMDDVEAEPWESLDQEYMGLTSEDEDWIEAAAQALIEERNS